MREPKPQFERRQSREDLEQGKQALQEMYEELRPYIEHSEVKAQLARLVLEDLHKVDTALVLKDHYSRLIKTLGNMDRRDQTEDDRREIDRIHRELINLREKYGEDVDPS